MSPDVRFAGRTVLVTGASRGIGAAIAAAFAGAGATVIGTATTVNGAEAITKSMGAHGFGRILDVSQPASIDGLFEVLEREGRMPEILINNAGITRDNLLLRMKDEEWHAVISANLTALFAISRRALRHMVKARFGRIINIGSVVGSSGNAGQTNYAASKAGVIGFTKSLAREVGSRNITVNVVAPGFIDTDMTRRLDEKTRESLLNQVAIKRFGAAEEVAAAVMFLASDTAGYITGETLHVNGGMYMS